MAIGTQWDMSEMPASLQGRGYRMMPGLPQMGIASCAVVLAWDKSFQ